MSEHDKNDQPRGHEEAGAGDRYTRSRRKLLKTLAATGGGVVVAKALPDQWVKPIADTVILPLHAFASGGPFTAEVEVAAADTDTDFDPRTFGVGVHNFGDGADDENAGDPGDSSMDGDGPDDDDAPGDDPDDDIDFLVSGNAPDGATVSVDFDLSGLDADGSDVDMDAPLDADVMASGGSYSFPLFNYDDVADHPSLAMTVTVTTPNQPDCVIVINFRDS